MSLTGSNCQSKFVFIHIDMATTSDKVKRFRSCFICGVELHDTVIVLEDSGRNQFIIDKKDKAAVESFAFWFKSVYLRGIPQVLSIIDYSIEQKNDDESFCRVNKIIADPGHGQQSNEKHTTESEK